MLCSVTLDLDLVDRGRSTVGGLGPRRRLGQEGPPTRVAQVGLVSTPGLTGIDYGMPEFVRRPRFRFRTLSVEPIMVSWQRRCVLIRSDFLAMPEPFRKFIFCIKCREARRYLTLPQLT
ncbi:hypothetical protein M9H77_17908 [Catharanthus roseus]|uniref:Uncharacterized protein n=1 Tax=Catharanthus roseus TaxID=4058 RepID=A0ACC0B5Z0_CATRO|nr:hypothetical protein M9H77_17908 [Catharanthus roseus]